MKISKNIVALIVLVVIYFLHSFTVLKPTHLNYFSLIDDGQSILNADILTSCLQTFSCEKVGEVLVEQEFGRFRPLYWVVQTLQYVALGLDAQAHHVFRVLVVGTGIVVLLFANLMKLRVIPYVGILSGVIFFTNYSYAENIVRLGPAEPYIVLFVACLPFLLLRDTIRKKDFYILSTLLLVSQLVKETSFIYYFPVALIILLSKKEFPQRWLAILGFISVSMLIIGRIISNPGDSEVAYTTKYQLSGFFTNFISQYNGLNDSTNPLLKLLFISSAFSFVIPSLRKHIHIKAFIFWFITTGISFGILVPWSFVLERYYLIVIFGLAILTGMIINAFIKRTLEINNLKIRLAVGGVMLLVISHMLAAYLGLQYPKSINYSNWYSRFTEFEYEQVKAIAEQIQNSETIYIDGVDTLDNWEVLYEIPLHLTYLYDINTPLKLASAQVLPENGVIFHREPFVHVLTSELLSQADIVDQKRYEIEQIDHFKFQQEFRRKPITTLMNPPLNTKPIIYSWTIYRP